MRDVEWSVDEKLTDVIRVGNFNRAFWWLHNGHRNFLSHALETEPELVDRETAAQESSGAVNEKAFQHHIPDNCGCLADS
jgi:hypothetical protein